MPKKLERRLKREARIKFPNDKEQQDRYVYGTIEKLRLKKKDEGDHEYR